MKIEHLRLKNLNSLEGEWRIDFTHPAFATAGIFAITGPTGAGKTTLLDALSLALYGRTPRLKVISKSVNELLTRQTGECFAEVTFSTPKGIFRCHWSQRRARKNPQGELQQPRHEIVDHRSGTVLENRIKNVAAKVEEVTGMTFDQFTRSILLAQGSFAAFLHASPDDRAPLLEQITGTDIYSRISQKVHYHTAEQEQIAAGLQKELDTLSFMPEEEKKALEEEIVVQKSGAQKLEDNLATLHRDITRLEKIEALKQDIASLKAESKQAQNERDEQVPQRQALKRAEICSHFRDRHNGILRLKRQLEEEVRELRTLSQEKNNSDTLLCDLENRQRDIATQLDRLEKQVINERKIATEVRELDVKIRERDERIAMEEKELSKSEKQRHQLEASLGSRRETMTLLEKRLTAVDDFFQQHKVDAELGENLGRIKERAKLLQSTHEQKKELQSHLLQTEEQEQQACKKVRRLETLHADLLSKQQENTVRYHGVEKDLAALHSRSPNIYKQLEELGDRLNRLEKAQTLLQSHEKTTTKYNDIKRRLSTLNKEIDESAKQLKQLEQEIASLQEEVALEEKRLALARQIKNYEDERRHLQQGQPCPLCGSSSHPFKVETPQEKDLSGKDLDKKKARLTEMQNSSVEHQTASRINHDRRGELKKTLEELDHQLAEYDDEMRALCDALDLAMDKKLAKTIVEKKDTLSSQRQRLKHERASQEKLEHEKDSLRQLIEKRREESLAMEKQLDEATYSRQNLSEKVKDLTEQLRSLENNVIEQLKTLEKDLAPFTSTKLVLEQLPALLENLETRKHRWRENKELQEKLMQEKTTVQNKQQQEQHHLDTLIQEGQRQREIITRLTSERQSLKDKRIGLYGDKNPEFEEKQLNDKLLVLTERRDELTETIKEKASQAATLKDRITRLNASSTKHTEEYKEEESAFITVLQAQGFTDLEDFQASILPEEKMAELESIFRDTDRHIIELSARLEEKRKNLALETEAKLPEAALDTLVAKRKETTEELNRIGNHIGRLQGKLEENNKLEQHRQHTRQQLLTQEKELRRWRKLDTLIGSANGKKFRNFAQGITFDIMVGHANGNLGRMTDRYILVRNPHHPLELDIIDNYRGGDIRSTKNLSGGESFLVSLALALGLSNMAGESIRVDSFFLDEGFGTLDEETLEVALQSLAGLQQEGKMIGVISHVSLLKERLETQIRVVPGTGGYSLLEGPGISSH